MTELTARERSALAGDLLISHVTDIEIPDLGTKAIWVVSAPGYCICCADTEAFHETKKECDEAEGIWAGPGFYFDDAPPGVSGDMPDPDSGTGPFESIEEAIDEIREEAEGWGATVQESAPSAA